MDEIKINKYRIVENDKKPFCVYIVEVKINANKHTVEKRYSQFYALHEELRKLHPTPNFPPKKVRSLQQRVLEKRKHALEKYLQVMLKFNQSRSQVLSFLGINKFESEKSEFKPENLDENQQFYQPFFNIKKILFPIV